jgi:adenylosuccinate lyase
MKLATKGLERQEAYVMVQRNAMKVWEEGLDFKGLILADQEIGKHLNKNEIEELFDLDYHLKYVDEIFERVFS